MNIVVTDQYGALTQGQINANALSINSGLSARGWTAQAVAGLLGNIQYESGLNPGQCENGYGIPTPVDNDMYRGGCGLIQWTAPGSANPNPLIRYAKTINRKWHESDVQLDLLDHADNTAYTYALWGYISTTAFPQTFAQFKSWDGSPENAASMWMRNVERPGDYSTESLRRNAARLWYDYITNRRPLSLPLIYLVISNNIRKRRLNT